MLLFRRLVQNNRGLAGLAIALALVMRMLVPAGFMPSMSGSGIAVSICSGTGPMAMIIAIPGVGQDQPAHQDHGKTEQPCAFGALSAPSLGAVDPDLLALAILFVMALTLRELVQRIVALPPYLRPPLRGPPALS